MPPQSTPSILPTPLPATQNLLEGTVLQAGCSEPDLSSQICWEPSPPDAPAVSYLPSQHRTKAPPRPSQEHLTSLLLGVSPKLNKKPL